VADERLDGLVRAPAGPADIARTRRGSGTRRAAAPHQAPIARIPRATYRLQLHSGFTFADAVRVVPYLARLGISHLYCSPVLRARAGSTHGYDIIDHGAINPELGGRAGLEQLVATVRAHRMGLVIDVVPNHMGIMGADNAWWLDVLEHGPAARHARFFDIDWHPLDAAMANRVLVPVLGDHYGLVLERGELKLAFDAAAGEFSVWYHGHRLPIDPREYPRVLVRAGHAALPLDAFAALPPRHDTSPEAVESRRRDAQAGKRRLAEIVAGDTAAAAAVERAVGEINGTAGRASSFEALHELLEAQAYRPAFWRVASDEINYRRFFDVNDLAALRMEDEAVFDATHRLVLELLGSGDVDGLRIDHPDGLLDPAGYFERLQRGYVRVTGQAAAAEPRGAPFRPLWVVVEKILAGHERLPESWAVHGTTGYRFAAVANGLMVDERAKRRFERIWRGFTGEPTDADLAGYLGKRTILKTALASELTVLASELLRIARADRRTRDYTFNTLRQALAEVIACFPVYRTYLGERLSRQDRRYIDWAVARAGGRSRAADGTIFRFVRAALLGAPPDDAPPDLAARYRAFALKFQQVTGPVTAKGIEDTAHYVYTPLASLNEVGTDPGMFGVGVTAFHGASADRAAHWPHTALATSTHDTKRSEDVRARIDVLSEMPAAWRLLLRRWSRMNRSKKRVVDGAAAPARQDEYLVYQTLLGTLPPRPMDTEALGAYRARIERYMRKAVREAKQHSSWINVNEEYEAAVAGFVDGLLRDGPGNLFLDDLREQAVRIAPFGALNGLSIAALKVASPGVPDFYQGTELVDLALVDPDNRRPVDYGLRAGLLESLAALASSIDEGARANVRELLARPDDGRAKLWLIWRALELRRRDPALFERGDYVPIAVAGERAAHAAAFARREGDRALLLVVGRLFLKLLGDSGQLPLGEPVWRDTVADLSPLGETDAFTNVLTGETVRIDGNRLPLGRAFAEFPVALLYAGRQHRSPPAEAHNRETVKTTQHA
jgi:(1->4)-alpha-D-glucan 1-alpha-D-glucosylmutase